MITPHARNKPRTARQIRRMRGLELRQFSNALDGADCLFGLYEPAEVARCLLAVSYVAGAADAALWAGLMASQMRKTAERVAEVAAELALMADAEQARAADIPVTSLWHPISGL